MTDYTDYEGWLFNNLIDALWRLQFTNPVDSIEDRTQLDAAINRATAHWAKVKELYPTL